MNLRLYLSSTGQVSDPIRNVFILQSPVFLINSRRSHFCVTKFLVLFLPKLQRYFAEFLQHGSPNALVFSTCPPESV